MYKIIFFNHPQKVWELCQDISIAANKKMSTTLEKHNKSSCYMSFLLCIYYAIFTSIQILSSKDCNVCLGKTKKKKSFTKRQKFQKHVKFLC